MGDRLGIPGAVSFLFFPRTTFYPRAGPHTLFFQCRLARATDVLNVVALSCSFYILACVHRHNTTRANCIFRSLPCPAMTNKAIDKLGAETTAGRELSARQVLDKFWCVLKRTLDGMRRSAYFELVYLVTALVPSDTACLASSPGRSRRTAVWISRLVMVERLL